MSDYRSYLKKVKLYSPKERNTFILRRYDVLRLRLVCQKRGIGYSDMVNACIQRMLCDVKYAYPGLNEEADCIFRRELWYSF